MLINSDSIKDDKILELQERLAMKDRFLSLITHELRNPISSIQLISESLTKSGTNLSNAELINEISEIGETARNVHTLLDNLLDWSRIQLGSFPFNPENIDLNFILRANIDLLKINTINKKIRIEVETENQILVFADANMVSTVIRNLITNAIKFTPEGGSISIQIIFLKDKVQFSIKDSGIGISNENKSKIFNYKDGFSTNGTENEKGSGIGLILSKEFVEKNSGTLWFESELNLGTTFHFTLMKENSI